MKYRADIDGLRSIAVLPVIFFHAGWSFFSGGYVGVDVFFVISGFLITALIVDQKTRGVFSFKEFYVRRIRRLAPALLPVVLFSVFVAYRYFSAYDFQQFTDSLFGVFTYTSNFVFLVQADYFAADAEHRLLLHTWSLAVEEQFYLILPALSVFLLTWRKKATLLWVFIAFAAISFAGCIWAMQMDMQEQAFYNSAFRFWELLAGSILALTIRPIDNKAITSGLRFGGLAMILCAVILYTQDTRFPGVTALLPVIGTVMLLAAGRSGNDLVLKLLKSPPAIYIGKLSYSLYLWHVPLLVYARVAHPDSAAMIWVMVAASFIAAAISYHLLEQPLRYGPLLKKPRRVFAFLAVISVFGLSAAAAGRMTHGADFRFNGVIKNVSTYLDRNRAKTFWTIDDCERRIPGIEDNTSACLDIDPSRETIMLLGDSHAQHLLPGFQANYPDANLVVMSLASCKPMREYKRSRKECDIFRDFLFNGYQDWAQIDRVVISVNSSVVYVDDLFVTGEWIAAKGIPTFYSGATPAYEKGVDSVLTANRNAPLDELRGLVEADIRARWPKLIARERVKSLVNMRYIDNIAIMCPTRPCEIVTDEGVPIIFDHTHLTPEGAIWLVKQWDLP